MGRNSEQLDLLLREHKADNTDNKLHDEVHRTRHEHPREGTERRDQSVGNTSDLADVKQRLLQHADNRLGGYGATQFWHHMENFEKRAHQKGLSPEAIRQTYSEVNRLLDERGTGYTTEEQRARIAEQILRHAADPTGIDQGGHSTCNAAVLESRMFTRDPEAATKLIVDVALQGKFTAVDGMETKVPAINVRPDFEAKLGGPDEKRSHASKIFQSALINYAYNLEAPPGRQGRYVEIPDVTGNSHCGERTQARQEDEQWTTIADYPLFYMSNYRSVYAGVTGAKGDSGNFCLADRNWGAPHVTEVRDEHQLTSAIHDMETRSALPAVVQVYPDGTLASCHVITVLGFTKDGRIITDNQWGKNDDKIMSATQLYALMKTPNAENLVGGTIRE